MTINERRLRWFAGLFVIALSMVTAADTVFAQVLYGSLTGDVVDSTAAAIPGARVEALNVSTGVARQAVTDARGGYQFRDLQPGTYKVTVSAPNFATSVQQGVNIEINTTRRVDMQLGVAQLTEIVSVSASAAVLQTDRADVNNQLQSSQLVNTPVTGQRNYQALLALIPGISTPFIDNSVAMNPQRSMNMSVNGIAATKNSTRLDGAANNFPWLPWHAAYIPPAEAIETVSVVSNSFDAEQGTAGGAAINVSIKSGTNAFHGSGWWYNTNSATKARNFFFRGNELPKDVLKQGGAAVGGPIIKNKLFFFADWERTKQSQNASGIFTIATDPLRQGNFAGTGALIYDPLTGNANGTGRTLFADGRVPANRIDPAAVTMIGLLPTPTSPGATNNYFASGDFLFTRDNVDIKANYNPAVRMSMFARYSISPHKVFDPQALGKAGGDALASVRQPGDGVGRTQSAAIGGTYTVTPRILIDGQVGFTRQVLRSENTDITSNFGLNELKIPGTNGPDRTDGGIPAFNISGFASMGNPSDSSPFFFRDNQYVFSANVGWVAGSHSLRFGWETTRQHLNHVQQQTLGSGRGGFTFTGGVTSLSGGSAPNFYNGWADFLLGMPVTMGRGLQTVTPAALRAWSHGFYVRDHWQTTRKLTLTYGVRWEQYPFATRDHRGLERFDFATDRVQVGGVAAVPLDTGVDVGGGNWSPRLGFAYRAGDKTVVRGGYGITVDPETFRNLRANYPTIIFLTFQGATSVQAAGTLRSGIPFTPAPSLGDGVINLPSNVATWTVPKKISRGYVQSFNFTLQRNVGAGFVAEAGYVGTRAIRTWGNRNVNASFPGGGNAGRALAPRIANMTLLYGYLPSLYDSLQTQLTRKLSPDIQFGTTYTWSKNITYGGGINWAPAWELNRGLAGGDRTHNLQTWTNANLPFGKGKRWATSGVASALLRDWQLNTLLSRTSGTPFGVTSSATSLNAPGNSQSADQVLPEVKILGAHSPGNSYFDPNAFAPVTAVRFGTSGRTVLRGPGFFEMHAGLTRNITIKERFTVQVRAESFNLTNTPAFNNPGSTGTIDGGNTAASNATRNADGSIRALNGYTQIISARDNSRQFRFSLLVRF